MTMKRRSVRIGEHVTSVRIEDDFWGYLRQWAKRDGVSLSTLLELLSEQIGKDENFTSHLRVSAFRDAAARAEEAEVASGIGALPALLAVLPLPAALTRASGDIVTANPRWLDLTVEASDVLSLVAPAARTGYRRLWRAAAKQAPRPVSGTLAIAVEETLLAAELTVAELDRDGRLVLLRVVD